MCFGILGVFLGENLERVRCFERRGKGKGKRSYVWCFERTKLCGAKKKEEGMCVWVCVFRCEEVSDTLRYISGKYLKRCGNCLGLEDFWKKRLEKRKGLVVGLDVGRKQRVGWGKFG